MYLFRGGWGKAVTLHVSLKNISITIKRAQGAFLPGLWPLEMVQGWWGGTGLGYWACGLSLEHGTPQGGDNREIICLLLLSPHHLNQTHYLGKCLEIPLYQIKDEWLCPLNLDGLRHISETHLFCFNTQHTTNPQATNAGSNENGKMDKKKTRKIGTGGGGQRSELMELLLHDLKASFRLLVSMMVMPHTKRLVEVPECPPTAH